MMVNIVCSGPGPHVPADGILGTADRVVTGMLCPSPACQAAPNAAQAAVNTSDVNTGALQSAVQTRLTQVETFIANNPNGVVLNAAQTNALARMVVALARLTLKLTATVGQGT